MSDSEIAWVAISLFCISLFGIVIGSSRQGNSGKFSFLLGVGFVGVGFSVAIVFVMFVIRLGVKKIDDGIFFGMLLALSILSFTAGTKILEKFRYPNFKKLKAKRDVKGLIKALGYSKGSTREEALRALEEISDVQAVGPLSAALKSANTGLKYLVQLGHVGGVVTFIVMLKEKRNAVIKVLGQISDVRAVELFIAALKNNDSDMRQIAAVALEHFNDVRAVEPFIVALQDSEIDARKVAATALGRIGDIRAVEPLIAALKDRDSSVGYAAAEALGQIGTPAVEPLIAALKDDDSFVRSWSAMALGKIGDARAVEPLIAALKDVATLQDNEMNIYIGVVEALGRIGDPQAVSPLTSILSNRDIFFDKYQWLRRIVYMALGEIGDKRAVPHLRRALDHEHDEVKIDLWGVRQVEHISEERVAVVAALEKLGEMVTS